MSEELREDIENTEFEEGAETVPEGMIDADPEDSGEAELAPDGTPIENEEVMSAEDVAFAQRIAARRKRSRRRNTRRKAFILIAMIGLFVVLITMCGREIIRLKAENYALQKQQQELQEERDRLQEELKNVGDKEYIKDQARKQLRLLDPGEIMFIFDDGKEGDSGK